MQNFVRTTAFVNAPSVLVTAGEVVVPRLCEKFNVTHYNGVRPMPRDVLLKEVPNHQALYCLLRDKIDKEVLSLGHNLKVISTMSVGFDHIDVEECKKRNIIVTITPDVLTETTAETTVALLLATARRFPEAIQQVRTGGWGTWSPFYMCGVGLRDSTIGIVGMGRIGASVATKLKTFHPKHIVFYDTKSKPKCASRLELEYAEMDSLLAQSDFVILTCIANERTKHMINKQTLAKMKKNAILINTSRGTLINQKDLYDALKSGQIRAAGLDVTTPEPLPTDSPLLQLDNCLVLPHIGSATDATRKDMMQLAEDGVLAVLEDRPLPENLRAA